MKISVLLFARAKDLAGSDQVEVDVPEPASVAALRAALAATYPHLAEVVARSLFAVDEEYASPSTPLSDRSRVACIPPVSGG